MIDSITIYNSKFLHIFLRLQFNEVPSQAYLRGLALKKFYPGSNMDIQKTFARISIFGVVHHPKIYWPFWPVFRPPRLWCQPAMDSARRAAQYRSENQKWKRLDRKRLLIHFFICYQLTPLLSLAPYKMPKFTRTLFYPKPRTKNKAIFILESCFM